MYLDNNMITAMSHTSLICHLTRMRCYIYLAPINMHYDTVDNCGGRHNLKIISQVRPLVPSGNAHYLVLRVYFWYVAEGNIESDISVRWNSKVLYIKRKEGVNPSKRGIG